MKIKKFTARTFSEALALVKKELSDEAIILSTAEKKGLRPQVEVTAAVDYDMETPVRDADGPASHTTGFGMRNEQLTKKPETRNVKLDTVVPSLPSGAYGRYSDDGDLRTELAGLKAMLESMKNNGYEVSLPANKRAMLGYLRDRRIREEFALRLCDKVSDLSEIPLMISSDVKIRKNVCSRKAVMLIGPTGVGKTTTIAKLAARAIKAGRKAAIINLDTYRIGAAEQARIYARIMGIPMATASSPAEFQNSLRKFAETRDIVFIDTMGRNPRDEAYLNDMAKLCRTETPLELHLLMSANADDEAMIDACRFYQMLPVDCIAFTKVDEAVRFGSLYNVMLTYQKPVAYLTTGQRVPGDIEEATVARLAGLIVKNSTEYIVPST